VLNAIKKQKLTGRWSNTATKLALAIICCQNMINYDASKK